MASIAIVWNPYAIPGLLAALCLFVVAILVFRARSGNNQNRAFAALSFVVGLWILSSLGLRFLTNDPNHAFAFWATGTVAAILQMPVAIWFYSTVPGAAAEMLRRPIVRMVVVAVFVLFEAVFLLRTDWFAVGTQWVESLRVFGALPKPGLLVIQFAGAAVSLVGLGILFGARTYPASVLERRKMRILAIVIGAYLAYLAVWTLVLTPFPDRYSNQAITLINFFGMQIGALWLCVGTAYGVLSSQLFDIDLRIKSGLRQGSFGAVFLLAFLVVGVMAENFLTARYGWVVGGIVAGLLLFAISPLQRFAEHVASAAMPRVRATDDYVTYRKHEVYRAALEGMQRDGHISQKERAVLDRLQEDLGISSRVAASMEKAFDDPLVPSRATLRFRRRS